MCSMKDFFSMNGFKIKSFFNQDCTWYYHAVFSWVYKYRGMARSTRDPDYE